MSHSWQDVALAFIAVIPAIVAAVSSLRNGSKIDKHNGEFKRQVDRLKGEKKFGRN